MIGRRMVTVALALALVQSLAPGAAMSRAQADADPTPFRPQPATNNGDYARGPTTRFPGVKAPDGADMYVELTLPAKGPKGIEPKEPFPVILFMTPYEGTLSSRTPLGTVAFAVRDNYVSRGYAFALGHVYGTGNSEGCFEMFGPNEVAATSAVIEALGSATWSNGRIGIYGTSYAAGSGLYAAALGSEEARDHLAAVVALDGPTSWGELWGRDGVPVGANATESAAEYAMVGQPPAILSGDVGAPQDPERALRRNASLCRADNMATARQFETTGDFSTWLDQRSALSFAPQVRSAILMIEGFHDGPYASGAIAPIGFFDRIPKDIPHKLVLGQWGHAAIDSYRADRSAMAVAWFDRFLLGHATGVEDWPEVQVQDSAGRWRVEDTWPSTGGPLGQLALTEEGGLGTPSPSGSTAYLEVSASDGVLLTPSRTFSTPPLPGPLHLVGLPVLDLWVSLGRSDAHIAVTLSAEDESGNPVTNAGPADGGSGSLRLPIEAYRSARHLEPIRHGEFRQMQGEDALTGTALRIPVRFRTPLDLVVPQGGKVIIEITGSNLYTIVPSMPSGSTGKVTILHDCAHPSALRFVMPDAEPRWLDVQMKPAEQPQLFPIELPDEGLRDGGGVASSKVCGQKPLDPQKVVEHP